MGVSLERGREMRDGGGIWGNGWLGGGEGLDVMMGRREGGGGRDTLSPKGPGRARLWLCGYRGGCLARSCGCPFPCPAIFLP